MKGKIWAYGTISLAIVLPLIIAFRIINPSRDFGQFIIWFLLLFAILACLTTIFRIPERFIDRINNETFKQKVKKLQDQEVQVMIKEIELVESNKSSLFLTTANEVLNLTIFSVLATAINQYFISNNDLRSDNPTKQTSALLFIIFVICCITLLR